MRKNPNFFRDDPNLTRPELELNKTYGGMTW